MEHRGSTDSAAEGPRQVYTPGGGPPRVSRPSGEIFARMGREPIMRMLRDFYGEIAKSPIRRMFAEELDAAAEKIGLYFVELLGGPPLYSSRAGAPMLRKRHLPFPIDQAARDTWVACFDRVLDRAVAEHGFPAEHLEAFRLFLHEFSAWMVNVAPEESDTEGDHRAR